MALAPRLKTCGIRLLPVARSLRAGRKPEAEGLCDRTAERTRNLVERPPPFGHTE
jgi:hypothetical protein